MSTNFPTSLDTFPSAATLATHTLGTDPHSTLHGNIGDTLAAVEAKVGVDASAVTTSFDYNLKNIRPGISDGRLTLTSGTAVTTADVTGATTVYFTPYKGSGISLYSTSASKWYCYTFAEISASLAGLTTSVPTDVFAYWTGSAVALELVNWTNGTTRATALSSQDGVRTKSGDATRLYLGTICGSGAGTCEDSLAKRFVYNYYNQQNRKLYVTEPTNNWIYTTSTFRPINNNTANRVEIVSGTGEEMIDLMVTGLNNLTVLGQSFVEIGVDSTTVNTLDYAVQTAIPGGFTPAFSQLRLYPTIGYHYYQGLEYGCTNGTETWYGASVYATVVGYYRG